MTLTNLKDILVHITPYLPQRYIHPTVDQEVDLFVNGIDWLEHTKKEFVYSKSSLERSTQEALP